MPKGVPKKNYSGEYKRRAVETMREEGMSYREAARQFELSDHHMLMRWERRYLEEGVQALYEERRGRKSTGRPPSLEKKVEEDLIAENQRLRAEVDYLKKLNALVSQEERQNKRRG